MFRSDTSPSSTLRPTSLTSSLRRSSVSTGMLMRIAVPSLLGTSPKSDVSMLRSTSLIDCLSHGCIISTRASGTDMDAS